MSDQLFRIDTTSPKTARPRGVTASARLDEHTKRIGRDGIAAARAALREARDRYDHQEQQAA